MAVADTLERRLLLSATSSKTYTVPTSPNDSFDFSSNKLAAGNGLVVIGRPGDDIGDTTDAGRVQVFDANSGSLIRTINDPDPNVFGSFGSAVAVLPGRRVAIADVEVGILADRPGSVRVFDVDTGTLLYTVSTPTIQSSGVAFGQTITVVDDSLLVVGDPVHFADDGAVHVFDAATGAFQRTISNPNPRPETFFSEGFGSYLGTMGNGRIVVGSTGDSRAYVFDVTTDGAPLVTVAPDGLPDRGRPVAGASSDTFLVATDTEALVYDTTGSVVRTISFSASFFSSGVVTPSRPTLADGGNVLISAQGDFGAALPSGRPRAAVLTNVNDPSAFKLLSYPAGSDGQVVFSLGDAMATLDSTHVVATGDLVDAFRFETTSILEASIDGGNGLAEGASVDFGSVRIGSPGPTRTITLSNPGSSALSLTINLPDGYQRAGGGGNSISVPANGSTSLGLQLTDTSEIGTAAGTVTLRAASGATFVFDVAGVVAEAPIPDGGSVSSTRTVTGSTGKVGDVNITLNILHPEDDDLVVSLVSPSGTRVELFSNVGTSVNTNDTDDPADDTTIVGSNFLGTKLDDDARRQSNDGPFVEAVPNIGTFDAFDSDDQPPFTGVFRSENENLSAFDGEVADGIWTLEITDADGNGKSGSLLSWDLDVRSRGLSFLDENGQQLNEFDSIAFSSSDDPIELSGDPGPSKQFFIRNDGDIPLAIGELTAPVDPTGQFRFTLTQAPPVGTVLTPGASVGFVVQQLFTDEGDFGDNLTMGNSKERFVVTGSVRRPLGRPEFALFRDADGQPIVNNQPTAIDFGTVAQGSTAQQVFILKNLGATDSTTPDPSILDVLNMSLPSGFVAEAVDGGALNRQLPGDDTGLYRVRIRMTTSALGTRDGAVEITNNDADEGTFKFQVRGTVTDQLPPQLKVTDNAGAADDRAIVIDTTQIGTTSATKQFTLANAGNLPLTVSAFALGGSNAGEFTVTVKNTSGATVTGNSFTIDGGKAYTVEVRLKPDAAGGRAASLTFNTNDPTAAAVTLTLGGNGSTTPVTNAEIGVQFDGTDVADGQDKAIDFGDLAVGDTSGNATRTFTVTNQGSISLNLGEPVLPDGFSISEPLAGSLGPGESDEFTVRLATSATGTFAGSVRISTNDPDESTFDFPITGDVVPAAQGSAPEVRITEGAAALNAGQTVAFGNATQGAAGLVKTFTVFNDGGSPLTLAAPTLPAGYVLTEPLSGTLAAGASDTFTVTLPTSTAGTFSGNLSISTNDTDENPYVIALSGTIEPGVGLLVAGFSRGKLRSSYVLGDKKAKGSVSVSFSRNGPGAAATGNVEVFLSTDDTLDTADRRIGGSSKPVVVKAAKPAKPGKPVKEPKLPKALAAKVDLTAVPAGTYRFIVRLTGTGVAGGTSILVGDTVTIQ